MKVSPRAEVSAQHAVGAVDLALKAECTHALQRAVDRHADPRREVVGAASGPLGCHGLGLGSSLCRALGAICGLLSGYLCGSLRFTRLTFGGPSSLILLALAVSIRALGFGRHVEAPKPLSVAGLLFFLGR
ncbi:hypothetical protein CKO44_07655 [Rubrivivax gelatinosus]|nr:hypothetical protein [Rubrivivax gelatinosus]MBZ8143087.1 hypothetical protein [Rubrivivax gelatinosus]